MYKLTLLAAVFGVSSAGLLPHTYLPPGQAVPGARYTPHTHGVAATNYAAANQASANYNYAANNYASARQSYDTGAVILRQNSDVNEQGYSYDFETSNGIRADQSAYATNGVQAQGSFSYKGDDGQQYSITYTADENGYRPQGAHLPTPPPVPEAILRSLEQNARDEAAGISDDGSYRDQATSYKTYNAPTQQYGAPAHQYVAPTQQYVAPAVQQYSAPIKSYLPPIQAQPTYNHQTGYRY